MVPPIKSGTAIHNGKFAIMNYKKDKFLDASGIYAPCEREQNTIVNQPLPLWVCSAMHTKSGSI